MTPTGHPFIWEGTDANGKAATGEINAASINLARVALRRQGVKPKRVRKLRRWFGSGLAGQVNSADIALLTRQLATMLKAGVPLIQAFDIVAAGLDNANLKALIVKLKKDVASGHPLAWAVRAQPRHFDPLFCSLVDAGEQSGTLAVMLDRLATYREKTEALKGKIKSAMNYPVTVLVIAGIVSGILLVKVVPQFEQIFSSFGAELPTLTQQVVKMSNGMQRWWFEGLATIIASWFAWRAAHKRSTMLQHRQDALTLKLPIIGPILKQSCVARFARTLATTFAAGLPLVDALRSAAGAAGNQIYQHAITQIVDEVSGGTALHVAMKSTNVFPAMIIQVVAIGEESGTLDDMLDKAATHYEDMVDNAVTGLTSLLEPVIMAVLGVVIGSLLIAMYLPVFSMGDAISGAGGY